MDMNGKARLGSNQKERILRQTLAALGRKILMDCSLQIAWPKTHIDAQAAVRFACSSWNSRWAKAMLLYVASTIAGQATFTLRNNAPVCDSGNPAVQLTWARVPGAATYEVYRDGGLIFTVNGGTNFYNRAGLIGGEEYDYSVAAYHTNGNYLDASTTVYVMIPCTVCSACSYSLNPSSDFVGGSGGNMSVYVTANRDCCSWSASSPVPWIMITAVDGRGSGWVDYRVGANPNCSSRFANLTIAGQPFRVDQSAGTGSYSLSPPSRFIGASGGNGNVSVTAGTGCPWTATSNNGWIRVTGGSPGLGNGNVSSLVSEVHAADSSEIGINRETTVSVTRGAY